jgi:hypothetical protein
MKADLLGWSQTLVLTYNVTLRNNPEVHDRQNKIASTYESHENALTE